MNTHVRNVNSPLSLSQTHIHTKSHPPQLSQTLFFICSWWYIWKFPQKGNSLSWKYWYLLTIYYMLGLMFPVCLLHFSSFTEKKMRDWCFGLTSFISEELRSCLLPQRSPYYSFSIVLSYSDLPLSAKIFYLGENSIFWQVILECFYTHSFQNMMSIMPFFSLSNGYT